MKYAFTTLTVVIAAVLSADNSNTLSKKNMSQDKITIEVWSDVVCPFCLVGKKKLEKAIDKYNAQDKVEVIWRSFQLDPTFPYDQSTPSKENLVSRKGYPKAQVDAMCGQLTEQGREYGIKFDFDESITFNTLDAHRLIQWSKTKNKSNQLKEALMTAHFSEGVDLSKKEQLIAVTASVGLDQQEALTIIESDQYTTKVQDDISKASELGIRGVPYFLVNGTQAISGAQSDAVFERMILSGLSNLTESQDSSSSGVCTPEGECK